MTRVARCSFAHLVVLALAGCVQTPAESDPVERDEPEADVAESIDYEFEPLSTLDQVTGWPASASTVPYFVSEPVEAECHWVEATSLIGPAIAETIDFESQPSLTGLACGIQPTAGSTRDDVIDEVAWQVDAGMSELVAAYADTVFDDGTLACETVDVPLTAPGLSVEYQGSWYVVGPAALACAETVARITEAVAALHLTEVLRHTTTFDDYLARGY